MPNRPLHGLLDELIDQFANALAARAHALMARSGVGVLSAVRMCPFPGCGKLGAGPRNRHFCKEHAKSVPLREQKRLLAERAKETSAALAAGRRTTAMRGRKLDMGCRVEGCKNRTRGPRFGFICDKHLKELSPREQREARQKWKAQRDSEAA